MNINVLTPDKEIFYGEILSVKVPGMMGQFQILKNHAPVVSSLTSGQVEIQTVKGDHRMYNDESGNVETVADPGRKFSFDIERGFIEVLNNEINLLVEGVQSIAS